MVKTQRGDSDWTITLSLSNQIERSAKFSSPSSCVSWRNLGSLTVWISFKGELQRENKLISDKRALKMLENDAGINQA